MCLDSLLRSLMMSALTQTGILEVLRPLLIISIQEWNESLSVCVSQISNLKVYVSDCVPYFPCLSYVVEKEKVWTFGFGFGLD